MDLTSASSVLGELLQSAWQDEIDAFLDERCREFTTLSYAAGGVVEYSHVQYSVWQDYRTLFSRVLDVILERVDGDTRQLIRLAEQRAEDIASGGVANSESAALERLLGAMIEYDDFTTFGATMRNRAGVMRRAERAGVEPSPRSPSASPRSPLRRTARPRRGSMMDEVVSMIAVRACLRVLLVYIFIFSFDHMTKYLTILMLYFNDYYFERCSRKGLLSPKRRRRSRTLRTGALRRAPRAFGGRCRLIRGRSTRCTLSRGIPPPPRSRRRVISRR